jgi:hypothetical protein
VSSFWFLTRFAPSCCSQVFKESLVRDRVPISSSCKYLLLNVLVESTRQARSCDFRCRFRVAKIFALSISPLRCTHRVPTSFPVELSYFPLFSLVCWSISRARLFSPFFGPRSGVLMLGFVLGFWGAGFFPRSAVTDIFQVRPFVQINLEPYA